MEERYKESISTWNTVAEAYEAKFMRLSLYNASYDLFCDRINNKNASLLEIGCGPGNITHYVIQQHPDWKITATDVAEKMLTLAKKNCPTANFRLLDCRNLSGIGQQYDAILSGFTLPYLNAEDGLRFIKDCFDLLHPGGVFYLSFIEGKQGDAAYLTGSNGNHLHQYYYSKAFMRHQLQQLGFEIMHDLQIDYNKSGEESEKHIILIATKIGEES